MTRQQAHMQKPDQLLIGEINAIKISVLIDRIFDELGSCDKCKHSYIGGSLLRCNKQNGIVKDVNDFCSDFKERK